MKLSDEQKVERLAERQEAKRLARIAARIEAEKAQKPITAITINIEWKKSRMWGHNPHAEAVVSFQDGTGERRDGYTASGCGYDKESTVVAEIFNDFLAYKLHQEWKGEAPYGMYYKDGRLSPSYNGGVGVGCYYRIAEFIGGKFENLGSGKSFDVYRYTDGKE